MIRDLFNQVKVLIGTVNALRVAVVGTTTEAVETIPTTIFLTVSAAVTPARLTVTNNTHFRVATMTGKRAARTNNTGIVFLGLGSVNDSQPHEISPGEEIIIQAPNGEKYDLNDFFLDVVTGGDGVIITYI